MNPKQKSMMKSTPKHIIIKLSETGMKRNLKRSTDKDNSIYLSKMIQDDTIIITDKKKKFDKIQHPFLIKTLHKLGIKRNILNLIKDVCKKPKASIIHNGQSLNAFLLRSKTRISTLATSIQCHSEVLASAIG